MPNPNLFTSSLAAALLFATTLGTCIFHVAARMLARKRAENTAFNLGTGLGGMVCVCRGCGYPRPRAGQRRTVHSP